MPPERGSARYYWDPSVVSARTDDRPQAAAVNSPANPSKRGAAARLVFGLDAFLRRRLGVIEYSSHPDCLFRIDLRRLNHRIELSDGTTLLPGDEIVQLHFWNERVPRYDGAGANFEWARRFSSNLITSLQELAAFLAARNLHSVKGVRADVALGTAEHMDQVLRFCGHYGFKPVRHAAPATIWSPLHRVGENVLIGMLILAHNRRAFGFDCLRRSRADVFLTRAELDKRFGRRERHRQ
jgi:YkoP-like protein